MPRLRRVVCAAPAISRRRRGKGFEYLDESIGERIDDEEIIERIRALAIPPAWQDVWICADPLGHIQATASTPGDASSTATTLWRERRDRQKFDDMVDFARSLPDAARAGGARSPQAEDLPRERVLACAVRLLDRGFFRIGSEDYAEENEGYGLATIGSASHGQRGTVVFDYEAKGGKRSVRSIGDRSIAALVRHSAAGPAGATSFSPIATARSGATSDRTRSTTTSRRSSARSTAQGLPHLERDGAGRRRLAGSPGSATEHQGGRNRAKRDAVEQVSATLGNTPAVCRASYIDPRVFDRLDGGPTVGGVFERLPEDPADWPEIQRPIEEAVLDLIDRRESPAIERVK